MKYTFTRGGLVDSFVFARKTAVLKAHVDSPKLANIAGGPGVRKASLVVFALDTVIF